MKICSAKPDEIDLNLISVFMTTKTTNWGAEEEYRLLVSEYTMPIIQSIEQKIYNKEVNSFDSAIKYLNEQTNSHMGFIYFGEAG